jgi:hypothetical protein
MLPPIEQARSPVPSLLPSPHFRDRLVALPSQNAWLTTVAARRAGVEHRRGVVGRRCSGPVPLRCACGSVRGGLFGLLFSAVAVVQVAPIPGRFETAPGRFALRPGSACSVAAAANVNSLGPNVRTGHAPE